MPDFALGASAARPWGMQTWFTGACRRTWRRLKLEKEKSRRRVLRALQLFNSKNCTNLRQNREVWIMLRSAVSWLLAGPFCTAHIIARTHELPDATPTPAVSEAVVPGSRNDLSITTQGPSCGSRLRNLIPSFNSGSTYECILDNEHYVRGACKTDNVSPDVCVLSEVCRLPEQDCYVACGTRFPVLAAIGFSTTSWYVPGTLRADYQCARLMVAESRCLQ